MNLNYNKLPSINNHQKIISHQIKSLFKQANMSSLSSLSLACIVLLVPNTHLSKKIFFYWFSTLVLSVIARLILVYIYNRTTKEMPYKPRRWGQIYSTLIFFTGATWASSLFVLSTPNYIEYDMMLMIAVIALSVGSAYATMAYPIAGLAFNVPVALALIVNISLRDDPVFYALTAMAVIYCGVIFTLAWSGYHNFIDGLKAHMTLAEKKEEAEKANAAKSQFLAAASHDLRQPLHAITLFTATLKMKVNKDENKQLICHIEQSITALSSLFNSLLDISKLNAGMTEVNFKHLALSEILTSLKNEFSLLAHEKKLYFAIEDTSLYIYSDTDILRRILSNLIANALNYTEQGEVKVLLMKQKDNFLSITVQDTGIGIAKDNIERIFEEYVQLHNPQRDRKKGLGLGLSIVRRLALLINSPLTVESTVKKGSSFSLSVPISYSTSYLPENSNEELEKRLDYNNLNVMVVDDDEDIRKSSQILLESWGCKVIVCADKQMAITSAKKKQQPPQLILADYRLQENNTGAETIAAIEAHFKQSIPAAIITGDTDPDRMREAQASGYTLLHKPLNLTELSHLLNYVSQNNQCG